MPDSRAVTRSAGIMIADGLGLPFLLDHLGTRRRQASDRAMNRQTRFLRLDEHLPRLLTAIESPQRPQVESGPGAVAEARWSQMGQGFVVNQHFSDTRVSMRAATRLDHQAGPPSPAPVRGPADLGEGVGQAASCPRRVRNMMGDRHAGRLLWRSSLGEQVLVSRRLPRGCWHAHLRPPARRRDALVASQVSG